MLHSLLSELPRFFGPYNLLLLAQAIGVTIALTIVGCGIGYNFGFALALLRVQRIIDIPPLRWSAIGFVELVRRMPFLVLLFLVMFGFQAGGYTLTGMAVACITIILRAAAIASETVRAGLESVHPNQWDAAATMNLSRLDQLRHVVLPQAWRVILPPAMVQFIQLLKATSIASQISVIELTYAGKIMNQKGFSATLSYGTVLILYYVLCLTVERVVRRMEKRLVLPQHH